MLIRIDDEIHDDKKKSVERVIKQVKEGLHTCSEMVVWVKSIKSHYVLPKSEKYLDYCLFFGSLVLGTGLYKADIVTDVVVSLEWRSFASHENYVKPLGLNEEICQNEFNNVTYDSICGINNETVQEKMRFSSDEWILLSNITMAHIILTFFLFSLSFFITNFYGKKYQGLCGRLNLVLASLISPLLTKFNVFQERINVTRLLASSPEHLLKAKAIKKLKKILRNQKKYRAYQEKGDVPSAEYIQINDEDFIVWMSRFGRKDFGTEKMEVENVILNKRMRYQKWIKDVTITKKLLKNMRDENFVSWIKQKANRDILGMQIDQERIQSASDEAILFSWMQWVKNRDIVEAQDNLSFAIKQETLNLVIEVTVEASLQFFIQVSLLLPDLILNTMENEQKSLVDIAKNMVNWNVLSILSSFATMANSFSRIQILEKNYALSWTGNPKALLLLLLDTTLNTICRTLIFGCFIYFTSAGHFNIVMAVSLYYGHVCIMLIFNVLFNRHLPSLSIQYFISILLNSMTSFYSYNHYDFFHERRKHKPTLLRQSLYTLITMTENIALTTYFVLHPSCYIIEDSYGCIHHLQRSHILSIVIFLIILQIVMAIFKLSYYGNHPASVSVSYSEDKMQIDILGVSWLRKNGKWIREEGESNKSDPEVGSSLQDLYKDENLLMGKF